MEYTFCHFIIISVKYNKWPNNLSWFKILMPHSISLAESMNLEHSITVWSHERYPVHLQCLRNIKNKIPWFPGHDTIFKSKRDYVRNEQKLLEYIQYTQIWQVLLVICSYATFICYILLLLALIVFFIKYWKTMQAMLMAFITTNTRNSSIPSTKVNSISRTFPPFFMIKIPKEEEIVKKYKKSKACNW